MHKNATRMLRKRSRQPVRQQLSLRSISHASQWVCARGNRLSEFEVASDDERPARDVSCTTLCVSVTRTAVKEAVNTLNVAISNEAADAA